MSKPLGFRHKPSDRPGGVVFLGGDWFSQREMQVVAQLAGQLAGLVQLAGQLHAGRSN